MANNVNKTIIHYRGTTVELYDNKEAARIDNTWNMCGLPDPSERK